MEFESIEQARDVAANPDNPLHEKFMAGDKEVLAARDRAYDKAYPGTVNLSEDVEITRQLGEAAAKPAAAAVDGGEDTERAAAEKALIEHWGDEAQANVAVVADWARSTFAEAELEGLHQKYPGLFDDVGIIKALHASLSR